MLTAPLMLGVALLLPTQEVAVLAEDERIPITLVRSEPVPLVVDESEYGRVVRIPLPPGRYVLLARLQTDGMIPSVEGGVEPEMRFCQIIEPEMRFCQIKYRAVVE